MEFRVSRFFILSRRDIIVNWKKYISMPVVIFALGIFITWSKLSVFAASTISCVFVCTFLAIMQSAFIGYKKEKSRITTLLLPASTEEKWLLDFFKCYIAYPIVLFALGLLGLLVGELVFNQSIEGFEANYLLVRSSLDTSTFLKLYGMISIAFFACLLFKKRGFLKTVVSILAFFIVCSLLQVWLLKDDMMYLAKNASEINMMIEYSHALEHYIRPLSNCLTGTVIVVFTAMSYIRLKWEEKA